MEEIYTVYILKCSDDTFYTGCTNNLENRLQRHNNGQVVSTKSRLPLEVETKIIFKDKYLAFNFEKYLKSGSGRATMLKRLVNKDEPNAKKSGAVDLKSKI